MNPGSDVLTHAARVQQLLDDQRMWMQRHAACQVQLLRAQFLLSELLSLFDSLKPITPALRAEADAVLRLTGTEPMEPVTTPARRRYEQGAADDSH